MKVLISTFKPDPKVVTIKKRMICAWAPAFKDDGYEVFADEMEGFPPCPEIGAFKPDVYAQNGAEKIAGFALDSREISSLKIKEALEFFSRVPSVKLYLLLENDFIDDAKKQMLIWGVNVNEWTGFKGN